MDRDVSWMCRDVRGFIAFATLDGALSAAWTAPKHWRNFAGIRSVAMRPGRTHGRPARGSVSGYRGAHGTGFAERRRLPYHPAVTRECGARGWSAGRPGRGCPAGPGWVGLGGSGWVGRVRLGRAAARGNREVCDANAFRRTVIVCRMGAIGSPEIVSVCDMGRGVPQTPHVDASARRTKGTCCDCG
jgi:hypothetical protein